MFRALHFLRYLLFPFSVLYWIVTEVRNFLFDKQILKSFQIPGKSIVIGNLSVGGTGKTPHTAYLIENAIGNQIKTSVLSRGYGRKTKGLVEANITSSASEIGDEPLLYWNRYQKDINVIVAEERNDGVKYIQQNHNDNQLILLDDAYQHRKVKAGLNIVITDFNQPFFKDFLLPVGRLREARHRINRADIVIVSKCDAKLSEATMNEYQKKINCDNVYFSRYEYADLQHWTKSTVNSIKKVLLVTGIANPTPLQNHLEKSYKVELIRFNDHHNFNSSDIEQIHKKFGSFADAETAIVTTEKDIMRLKLFDKEKFENYPWYYQPISVKIEKEELFKTLINEYVRSN